jgi:hypothetical protein
MQQRSPRAGNMNGLRPKTLWQDRCQYAAFPLDAHIYPHEASCRPEGCRRAGYPCQYFSKSVYGIFQSLVSTFALALVWVYNTNVKNG